MCVCVGGGRERKKKKWGGELGGKFLRESRSGLFFVFASFFRARERERWRRFDPCSLKKMAVIFFFPSSPLHEWVREARNDGAGEFFSCV